MKYQISLYGTLQQTQLPLLITRLSLLSGDITCQMNYSLHDIVFIPSNETPYGIERKDDVVLRLQAPFINNKDSTFIPLQQREWTLMELGDPEPPKSSHSPNVRAIHSSSIHGHVLSFLNDLGYKYSFDIVRIGYSFTIGSIRIVVYKCMRIVEPLLVSTAIPLGQEQEEFLWIVHAFIYTNQESVTRISDELISFSYQLKDLVELYPLDHVLLMNRLSYNS